MAWTRAILHVASRRRGGAQVVHPVEAPVEPVSPARPASRVLLDATTRTFWSRGADSPITLVEAEAGSGGRPLRDRVRAMVTAHERGSHGPSSRPPGNPAFSEALFVELIRGGQHARAYALLAPECQQQWGGAERFAAAHRTDHPGRLEGVNVLAVRHLDEWVDPHRGDRHRHVAELDVEYTLGAAERPLTLRRTVHLVAVDGRWRSLSYPVEATAAS